MGDRAWANIATCSGGQEEGDQNTHTLDACTCQLALSRAHPKSDRRQLPEEGWAPPRKIQNDVNNPATHCPGYHECSIPCTSSNTGSFAAFFGRAMTQVSSSPR
ncbi:unnamed protein product [Prorocentrum cordatum]|uniref:Uncharacterized protein n=1 Tax=Prorocentrum cordatum TaxID=2364126 RepID=A0ABN9QTS5_9DINO|nr:unnamed protein product [Polarella glacialis]